MKRLFCFLLAAGFVFAGCTPAVSKDAKSASEDVVKDITKDVDELDDAEDSSAEDIEKKDNSLLTTDDGVDTLDDADTDE